MLIIKQVVESSAPSLFQSWASVPCGIVFILLGCFGVDTFFKSIEVSFPASVACLILLFFGLLLCELVVGGNRTRKLVHAIDVPGGWSLRWINILFTPTFVLLPLSPPIGGVEVAKIIAVFIIGFIVVMVFTAYMTRGLQILTGSSKRARTERAEELRDPNNRDQEEEIPISHSPPNNLEPPNVAPSSEQSSSIALDFIEAPPRLYTPSHLNSESQTPILQPSADSIANVSGVGETSLRQLVYRQTPLPPLRSRQWASFITANLDWLIYATVAVFVGLPIYYAKGYAMPLQTCVTVLSYFAALRLPPTWRRYLHPVIVSAFITVITIYILGLIKGTNITGTLAEYRTGRKYLQLWQKADTGVALPGAGDLLASVLDASIVSLALPMYQYRRELKSHFTAIVVPNIILSIASLFGYPIVCCAIGISAERSLAFAARSLTLALATPAMDNLGGDLNTVSAVAIMSGIMGALVGERILALVRIPEDDYVTRGVTLGANSSAIATALLLQSDPRAAALSSLSMSLFGTITVLFTSIPPIRELVRSIVGL
ncbi:LrgB-like family-domain-containing protein [Bombardia bombarda]|uniref:LrgB-like family-domain-containing protein n=1 Tax=Bombardia bombarda TaxID=252184 RepID=A0AA39U1X0_9PEZI|nr:LrgB-like family-domain-containing protein [Bombardia bombarda]